MKRPRTFNDDLTVPFYDSISLPVSNFLLTFGPECAPMASSLSTSMRTPRTKPPVGGCGPSSLGLGFPGGQAQGACCLPLLCPLWFRPYISEKPNLRLCSPPLTPFPHLPTHPFSGHKGPFLFAEPKEAGCQGDRSRNSRELAMGEGLCPQTAVSGSSPSWD